MNGKAEDKKEIQASREEFRRVVGHQALDPAEKWNWIRHTIEQHRKKAAAALEAGSGVVAHDRRAKLAAFACEYAIGYYEAQGPEGPGLEARDEYERRLGDLARYLTGIKSVPRAAPEPTPREAAECARWMLVALHHYDTMRGPLRLYSDRVRRLMEEQHNQNRLLPFLFTARKCNQDTFRPPRERLLTLDAALSGDALADVRGVGRDFVRIAVETVQAAVSREPLRIRPAAHARLIKAWNEPLAEGTTSDELVSVIAALALLGFFVRRLVPNAALLYQQLLRSARLHSTVVRVFVEGQEPAAPLSPALRSLVQTTRLDSHPLTNKIRVLISYPPEF